MKSNHQAGGKLRKENQKKRWQPNVVLLSHGHLNIVIHTHTKNTTRENRQPSCQRSLCAVGDGCCSPFSFVCKGNGATRNIHILCNAKRKQMVNESRHPFPFPAAPNTHRQLSECTQKKGLITQGISMKINATHLQPVKGHPLCAKKTRNNLTHQVHRKERETSNSPKLIEERGHTVTMHTAGDASTSKGAASSC